MPIRPGLDPKWLFKNSIDSLNKNYGQISITGPNFDPEKIELTAGLVVKFYIFYEKSPKIIIFEPFFNIQKSGLFYFLLYTIINTPFIIIIKIFFLITKNLI